MPSSCIEGDRCIVGALCEGERREERDERMVYGTCSSSGASVWMARVMPSPVRKKMMPPR
jgi:hypothetical protein